MLDVLYKLHCGKGDIMLLTLSIYVTGGSQSVSDRERAAERENRELKERSKKKEKENWDLSDFQEISRNWLGMGNDMDFLSVFFVVGDEELEN